MSGNVLSGLTPAQREAVDHADGPLLILAGPGSGKTRVVTHRVARLLQKGISPRQILALTFTNKAADEMRSRLGRMVPAAGVWVGTFHRFCAQLLRTHAAQVGLAENFSIYDADDSLRTVKSTIQLRGAELEWTNAEQIAEAISRAKNNLMTHRQFRPRRGDPLEAMVAEIYPTYQHELLARNAADFDDLLLYVVDLLRENPALRAELDDRYRYVLVDEYQDTNLAQYAIVRAVSIDYPNLAVTGDPDQSIYGWRGASLRNILGFEKDFPGVHVVRLEQNYRSTPNILHVADVLISHNARRKPKGLFSAKPPGRRVRLAHYATEKLEAEGIASEIVGQMNEGRRRPRDFAVFYRVNALSRPVEDALRLHGIPYRVVSGVEFYQRKETKDVLAYLQLINNPRDNAAFERIINKPTRGIGRTTLARLNDYARHHGGSLLDAARRAGLIESLGRRAALALARFVSLYDQMGEYALGTVEEILQRVLELSGYRERLQQSSTEEDHQRLANIEELLTVAREFDMRAGDEASLEAFLEQTCLVNETDDWDPDVDRVALMTLHASKGLEFPVVFVVALEEGILPHERAKRDRDELEEERRLLFVGITRAEQELQLSMVRRRSYRGRESTAVPSSFAMELPRTEMEQTGSPVSAHEADGTDDECAYDEPVWSEEDFVQDGAPQAERDNTPGSLHVTTAAQMLEEDVGASSSPPANHAHAVFRPGMAVIHPDYGPGKIVQLSGTGSKQTATINFALAGQKTFRLANALLRPASP